MSGEQLGKIIENPAIYLVSRQNWDPAIYFGRTQNYHRRLAPKILSIHLDSHYKRYRLAKIKSKVFLEPAIGIGYVQSAYSQSALNPPLFS